MQSPYGVKPLVTLAALEEVRAAMPWKNPGASVESEMALGRRIPTARRPPMRGEADFLTSLFSCASPQERVLRDHPLRTSGSLVDEVPGSLNEHLSAVYVTLDVPQSRLNFSLGHC
jgi:hypothetical protein